MAAHSHSQEAQAAQPLGEPYAALDLGSNSFHLIVAYYRPGRSDRPSGPGNLNSGARSFDDRGRLQIVDRHKETVRLAEGLTAEGDLSPVVALRALACLRRFGQRLRHLSPNNVRVVGTNTLRKARNSGDFVAAAERALGCRVEIVSGREEARLIYLGVSHALESRNDAESRLVVDIGGGSTELILGRHFQPRLMESLHMGCVSMSARFFPNGEITAAGFAAAENAARQELEAVEQMFLAYGWDAAVGASGTLLAVHDAIAELNGDQAVTRDGIDALRERLIDAGCADRIGLSTVDEARAPVFAGGVAVASAVFDALGVGAMTVSQGALREGLLHDLLGRVHAQDIRETTVDDLARRYHVDVAHARRVAQTAAVMFEAVPWDALALPTPAQNAQAQSAAALSRDAAERLLRWGALLHEVGMDIAHSQYHKHGGYLLEHMDMPGFSRSEQRRLAALVRAHRRKFPLDDARQSPRLAALCVLLRLAVVLHRGRATAPLPPFSIQVDANRAEVRLVFPAKWLRDHPLTKLDLEQEAAWLALIPLRLTVEDRGAS